MGLFDFSTSTSPKYGITNMLKKTRESGGFDPKQRNELEMFFFFALQDRGASRSEQEAGIEWLRQNTDKHTLTDDKIDFVANALGLVAANDNEAPGNNKKSSSGLKAANDNFPPEQRKAA